MLIVVLGPDGSGKTTLAKMLAASIRGLTYVYFGGNPENRRYFYFQKYLHTPPKGKFFTFLKYIFIYLNDRAVYRQSRNQHIISDRCPLDKIFGAKLNNDKWRYLYHRFVQKTMPHPDFVILLKGDANKIYARKREIPPDVIQKYVAFYETYLKRNKIESFSIDTVKNGIHDTYDLAYEQVSKRI